MNLYRCILESFAEKNIFYNVLKIGLTNTKLHRKIPNKNLKERTKLVPTKNGYTKCYSRLYLLSQQKKINL